MALIYTAHIVGCQGASQLHMVMRSLKKKKSKGEEGISQDVIMMGEKDLCSTGKKTNNVINNEQGSGFSSLLL